MHRIDGPGSLPGNVFREGDPAVGLPATTVTADFMNAVQEEICAVIAAAGTLLAKGDNAQLLAAIRAVATPVGTVIEGYFSAAPAGFLLLNGATVSRATFDRLWAHVSSVAGLVVSDAAWTAGATGKFSSGNGTTTFRLPNLGGYFTRVLDGGAGVDAGRDLGSVQADDLKSHSHQVRATNYNISIDDIPLRVLRPDFALSGESLVGNTGGTETRPKNVALQRAIRY